MAEENNIKRLKGIVENLKDWTNQYLPSGWEVNLNLKRLLGEIVIEKEYEEWEYCEEKEDAERSLRIDTEIIINEAYKDLEYMKKLLECQGIEDIKTKIKIEKIGIKYEKAEEYGQYDQWVSEIRVKVSVIIPL